MVGAMLEQRYREREMGQIMVDATAGWLYQNLCMALEGRDFHIATEWTLSTLHVMTLADHILNIYTRAESWLMSTIIHIDF